MEMTERIKLTEEDFTIMEPDEYYWDEGNCLAFAKTFPEDNIKLKQLKQQILDDQEKAKRWDTFKKLYSDDMGEWLLDQIDYKEENKQLKEDNKKKEIALLDMIQQMRWDELAKHRILKIDDSLKQKTEKIKELIANINVSECESTTIDIINEINTILSNES